MNSELILSNLEISANRPVNKKLKRFLCLNIVLKVINHKQVPAKADSFKSNNQETLTWNRKNSKEYFNQSTLATLKN
jgi:hypothetical protein